MTVISKLIKKIDENQLLINQNRPFEQKAVTNLRDYYKIGFVYASNALEGSTLTLSETKVVIEDGITIGGKPLRDHLDAIGNARAFDYIWQLAQKALITEKDIKEIHKICFQPKEEDLAGNYRNVNVFISGSQYNDLIPTYEIVSQLMKTFAEEITIMQKSQHPAVYAANLHRDFVYIHPFTDGNGRVARLLMNHALLATGYPVVIISPNFKNEYINALEKSRKPPDIFVEYILEQIIEAQKEYIRLLRLWNTA